MFYQGQQQLDVYMTHTLALVLYMNNALALALYINNALPLGVNQAHSLVLYMKPAFQGSKGNVFYQG